MTRTLLRWTIEKAATEFGCDRKRLTRQLRQSDDEPSHDGRFSTKQIVAAIFNDTNSERTRLYREQADKLSLENNKTRSEHVGVDIVWKAYEGIFAAMRKTILASPLSDAEKADALAQLRHDLTEPVPV